MRPSGAQKARTAARPALRACADTSRPADLRLMRLKAQIRTLQPTVLRHAIQRTRATRSPRKSGLHPTLRPPPSTVAATPDEPPSRLPTTPATPTHPPI